MPTNSTIYATTGSGATWTTPGNATANDSNYAYGHDWEAVIGAVSSGYITLGSFTGAASGIGGGDSIDGIEVHVGIGQEAYPTYNGTITVQLGRNDALVGSSKTSGNINGGADYGAGGRIGRGTPRQPRWQRVFPARGPTLAAPSPNPLSGLPSVTLGVTLGVTLAGGSRR